MRYRAIGVLIACFTVFLPASSAAPYSDWTGVYARVDKVVFEPNATTPERVQVWGAFAIATKQDRNNYDAAQRGYLYFSLAPGKEEVCRREWADLKAVAGTGEIVGFGSRAQPVRLRKVTDNPADPDVHPVGTGITKMSNRNSDYGPIRDLKALPKEPK